MHQGARGTTSDIDRADRLVCLILSLLYLFEHGIDVFLSARQKGGGEEVAVCAALLAKRYMYVDASHLCLVFLPKCRADEFVR